MKKFKKLALALVAVVMLHSAIAVSAQVQPPILVDEVTIVDGVDIGYRGVFHCEDTFNAYLSASRSRSAGNSQWYHSPSFTHNVQIGGGQVFIAGSSIAFIRPFQRNVNDPWLSVSVTYQAIIDSTGAVRQGINRFGTGTVTNVILDNVGRGGRYRLNLANISRVPAMAEGTVLW